MSKTTIDEKLIFTVSKDKILSYTLVVLIVITLVAGYSMIKNRNNSQAQTAVSQQSGDPMHSGDSAGNIKKFSSLPVGSVAPNFSLPSTTGQTINLSDYRGKNVFLFFMEGVMCSPCWQEVSRLERYKEDFAKINTVVIPISVDDKTAWGPILTEEKITMPILIDADRKVSTLYKAIGAPSSMHADRPGHTYIHIDVNGKIHASSDFPEMNVKTSVLLEHIAKLKV